MTGPLLPLLALVVPLALGLLAAAPPVRRHAMRLLPVAPLPALLLALAPPATVTRAPDLLLGATLGLDPVSAVFLGFVAVIWTAAGIHAAATMADTPKPAVFAGFWCLTLAGNLGVFLARDVATFYVAFAAVSLAATVLVVHDASARALRAGRLYLALAVLGETALLGGFLIAASEAPSLLIADLRAALAVSPLRDLAVALLVLGFGIKAGFMPLHVWLPLAHPAAPTPASAALSGAIVKAGIFGLIAFLPAGAAGWGALLLVIGLAGAFGAVLLGLCQKDPKAILAYSTISQMGLIAAVIGAGLVAAEPAAANASAALQSLHHGLAKAALFLVAGLAAATAGRGRAALLAAAALVALSIAGLPFTGGAAAKAALKAAMPAGWATFAVTLSGATTALLLGRFLLVLWRKPAASGRGTAIGLAAAAALGASALVLPWIALPGLTGLARGYPLSADALADAAWPIALACLLAALALLLRLRPPPIPEGDLAVPLEHGAARVARASLRPPAWPRLPRPDLAPIAEAAERALARWPAAGLLLVLIALALGLRP